MGTLQNSMYYCGLRVVGGSVDISVDCALKRSPQCNGVSDCKKPQNRALATGNAAGGRKDGFLSQEFIRIPLRESAIPLSFCLFCRAGGI